MKTLNRFLHFELSPRQLMVATAAYFVVMLLLYGFCMFWVLKQILTQPEATVKVVGPVLVGGYIHRRFKTLLKPQSK
jgi:hypothetical protein